MKTLNRYIQYTIILIVFIGVIYIDHIYMASQKNELIDKYEKEINALISKKELSNNKITKIKLDMNKRKITIADMTIKNNNDTIYHYKEYNLSKYDKLNYSITMDGKLYKIKPELYISDWGFMISPTLQIVYIDNSYTNIGLTVNFFHYKKAYLGAGVIITNKDLYASLGVGYNLYSNIIISTGLATDFNSKKMFIGIGLQM